MGFTSAGEVEEFFRTVPELEIDVSPLGRHRVKETGSDLGKAEQPTSGFVDAIPATRSSSGKLSQWEPRVAPGRWEAYTKRRKRGSSARTIPEARGGLVEADDKKRVEPQL